MKETIAKINEVIAILQADLAKAAEGNKAAAARARKSTLDVKSNFFFSTFKKFSFQLISAVCIQHKVGHFCYSL